MTEVEHDTQGWAGRTVRGRDGSTLGRIAEVFPPGPGGGTGTWGVVRSRFGRRRMVPLDGAQADGKDTVQVPVDRASLRAAPAADSGAPDAEATTALQHHYTGRAVLADAHARQQERFGGTQFGAAFFGWLVAVGMTVLLAGVAAAVAAAVGAGTDIDAAGADATAVGVAGAVVVLVVLLVAYFAGGYVAGRLARFDGSRNGLLAWLIGVVVTVLAGVAGAVVGSRFDVLGRLQLPVVPMDTATMTVGGVVALVVVLLGTLFAAILGGKAGERFHRRVDREGDRVL